MLFNGIEFQARDSFDGVRDRYQHFRASLSIDGWEVRIDSYGQKLNANSKFDFSSSKDGVFVNARNCGSRQIVYLVEHFKACPPTDWIEIDSMQWHVGDAAKWVGGRIEADGERLRPWVGYQRSANDRILISTNGWTDSERVEFKLRFG